MVARRNRPHLDHFRMTDGDLRTRGAKFATVKARAVSAGGDTLESHGFRSHSLLLLLTTGSSSDEQISVQLRRQLGANLPKGTLAPEGQRPWRRRNRHLSKSGLPTVSQFDEQGHERKSKGGQAIFDLGRHFGQYFASNKPIGHQFAKLLRSVGIMAAGRSGLEAGGRGYRLIPSQNAAGRRFGL
jgi:hypothetical protein